MDLDLLLQGTLDDELRAVLGGTRDEDTASEIILEILEGRAGRGPHQEAGRRYTRPRVSGDAMDHLTWCDMRKDEDGRPVPFLESLGDGGEEARRLLQDLDVARGTVPQPDPILRFSGDHVRAAWRTAHQGFSPAQRRVADLTIGPLLHEDHAEGGIEGPALIVSRGKPALRFDFRSLARQLGVAGHSRVWAHYQAVLAALKSQLQAAERELQERGARDRCA